MTWTKLGDEFGDEARELTDAEFRTHVEALGWSNRRQLDLYVPVRDLRRFAETAHPDAAAAGLVAKGWWADHGGSWYIGLRFPDWQLESAVVEYRRAAEALRQRRSRLHKAGNHSLCLAGNCPHVTRDNMRDPVRDGSVRENEVPERVAEPDAGANTTAEHEVREREARAKKGFQHVAANPPVPSPQTGDGPITEVHQAQQTRVYGSAGASVADRYARARANGTPHPNKRLDLSLDIIDVIRDRPDSTSSEVRQLVRATKQNVLIAVNQLVDEGVITKQRRGRHVGYVLSEPS